MPRLEGCGLKWDTPGGCKRERWGWSIRMAIDFHEAKVKMRHTGVTHECVRHGKDGEHICVCDLVRRNR